MRRTLVALVALQVGIAVVGVAQALQPGLTEIDRLRLQLVQTQRHLAETQAEGDVCRAVLGPLRAKANAEAIKAAEDAAVAAIEAAHPGFQFDRATGRLMERAADGGK